MNHRRKLLFVLGAGALASGLQARAQPPAKVRRIGYLSLSNAETAAAWLAGFRAGMLELRWVEGRDYVIDPRYADGVAQVAPGLAAELVETRPDLLLANGDAGVRLLAQRTKTIPIVFAVAQDPIGTGIAASLQRPGGNVTGLSNLASELSAKRLQLLKEAFPRVAHVALLFEPDNAGSVLQAKEIEAAAPLLGMRVTPIELRQLADIEPAFKRAIALDAQAYIVTAGGIANSQRQAIVDRIIRLKVPSMYVDGQYVEAGGLMSYSISFTDNFRRAAAYVDKILKGAKPGELPIEQPTRFELVVNLKTAKALGLTIPQSVLRQADRMIQ
jgi:putative tryptophan/tyrosine transport system substrate-binding protein